MFKSGPRIVLDNPALWQNLPPRRPVVSTAYLYLGNSAMEEVSRTEVLGWFFEPRSPVREGHGASFSLAGSSGVGAISGVLVTAVETQAM